MGGEKRWRATVRLQCETLSRFCLNPAANIIYYHTNNTRPGSEMEVTNLHQKQKGKKWRGPAGNGFSFSLIYPATGLFTAPFMSPTHHFSPPPL